MSAYTVHCHRGCAQTSQVHSSYISTWPTISHRSANQIF